MSLDKTLLAIRREFGKDEKYKLFLKHLDNIETELRLERRRGTDLLKQNTELASRVEELEDEIGEYKGGDLGKKFVRMKAYNKLMRAKTMFESRFWEMHAELEKCKGDKPVEQTEPIGPFKK